MNRTVRLRLEYLDGLRGLAALYVMLGHAYVAIRAQVDPYVSALQLDLLKLIDAGHFAVALFIVLSGYCLMLPVVRSADRTLAGGWWGYIKRRARRIMPPYYAALAIAILLLVVFPQIAKPEDLGAWSIAAHALLVHNLFPSTMLTINGPMWSVAMEWQIYFFLPFLLLPLFRRFGPFAMLGAGIAAGLAPFFLLPAGANFAWTFPWYIGLFAMGATAAAVNFSTSSLMATLRNSLPWGWISLALLTGTGAMLLFRLSWAWQHLWLADSLLGLTVAAGLITLTNTRMVARDSGATVRFIVPLLVLRMLEWRWMGLLGAFSYSLYLIHEPILLVFSSYLLLVPLQGLLLLAVQYTVIAPIVVGLCFLFYHIFERPFVSAGPAAGRAASERASAASD